MINIGPSPLAHGDFLLTPLVQGAAGVALVDIFTVPDGFFLRLFAMAALHNDAASHVLDLEFLVPGAGLVAFAVSGLNAANVPVGFNGNLLIPPKAVISARSLGGIAAGSRVSVVAYGLLVEMTSPQPFPGL